MWQSYVNGLLVALGLIMAIGTQNAFVLAQSLRREHHLPVAALCVVRCAAGGGRGVRPGHGVGAEPDLAGGGALGRRRLSDLVRQPGCAGRSKQSLDQGENHTVRSLRAVMLSALAVTLLNPHVYLDTVLLIGSLGAQQTVPAPMWWARPVLRCCGFSPWPSAPHGWRRGWRASTWRILDLWWP
jgi:L-lysine exporter family protein LysE/ArgO